VVRAGVHGVHLAILLAGQAGLRRISPGRRAADVSDDFLLAVDFVF
jgi:hypothetical protein